jgi:hypothetical protein
MAKHKRHIAVKPHFRAPPGARGKPAPMPGPNEFDAGQEQQMRQGAAASRLGPQMGPQPPDDGLSPASRNIATPQRGAPPDMDMDGV